MIHNVDCVEFMATVEDGHYDHAFTSPPYNRKRNDKYTHYDDTKDDYFAWLVTVIDELIRITKGTVFFNIQKNYYNSTDVYKLFGKYAEQIAEVFIWEKSNPMPASGGAVTNAYEFIIAFGDSIESNQTYTKNHITTSVAKMLPEHKAIMHPDIAKFFIDKFTKKGETVFDPFMGSGTTAIVCEDLGRYWEGCEISKEYVDIAESRIRQARSQLSLFG